MITNISVPVQANVALVTPFIPSTLPKAIWSIGAFLSLVLRLFVFPVRIFRKFSYWTRFVNLPKFFQHSRPLLRRHFWKRFILEQRFTKQVSIFRRGVNTSLKIRVVLPLIVLLPVRNLRKLVKPWKLIANYLLRPNHY